MSQWKGKYLSVDFNNPQGYGICDYTGFAFNHNDLVRQMDWRGDRLVWTGFMVGRPFLDIPNEQARPPKTGVDPVPFKNPRFPADYIDPLAESAPPYNQLVAELQKVRFNE